MQDLHFHIAGRTARNVAARIGAFIEGEFARRPDVQEQGETLTLSLPGSLFITENQAAYRNVQDKIARLIGIAAWEAREGVLVTVRTSAADSVGRRLDELRPEGLVELAQGK